MDDKSGKQAIEYGIVPIDVMASMSGFDFVRAIFARRLPEPPIMQTVEPAGEDLAAARLHVPNGDIDLHQFLPILAHIVPSHLFHAGRLQSLPRS